MLADCHTDHHVWGPIQNSRNLSQAGQAARHGRQFPGGPLNCGVHPHQPRSAAIPAARGASVAAGHPGGGSRQGAKPASPGAVAHVSRWLIGGRVGAASAVVLVGVKSSMH